MCLCACLLCLSGLCPSGGRVRIECNIYSCNPNPNFSVFTLIFEETHGYPQKIPEWSRKQSEEGSEYYYSTLTGESQVDLSAFLRCLVCVSLCICILLGTLVCLSTCLFLSLSIVAHFLFSFLFSGTPLLELHLWMQKEL